MSISPPPTRPHRRPMIEEPRAKRNYDEQYKKILEGPCPLHKNSKHKMKDCLGLAKEFQAKKSDDDNNDGARGH